MTEPFDELAAKYRDPSATPNIPPWAPPHQPIAGGYAPGGYPPLSPQPYYDYGFTPPRSHPRNTLGIASLVLGISALAVSWFPFVGVILAMCAVLTGIAARRRIKRGEADNKGVTVGSIVLGIVAFVISGLISAVILIAIINYENCIEHAEGRYEYAQC